MAEVFVVERDIPFSIAGVDMNMSLPLALSDGRNAVVWVDYNYDPVLRYHVKGDCHLRVFSGI